MKEIASLGISEVNTAKKVAVLILNWNGAQLLDTYLPSVLQHTDSELAHIYVVDNGSTDASKFVVDTIAKREEKEVKWLQLGRNYGFAGGYNRAINAVSEEWVILLNSDVRVTKDWLKNLWQCVEKYGDRCNALQPKIRWDRHPEYYEYSGAEGGYLDYLGYPFCRGRLFAEVEPDNGQYGHDPKNLFWASGASLMIRRKVYSEMGGLDERFFAHQEEIDLCWRLLSKFPYTIWVVPESVVYHLGGATLDATSPHKSYLNFRNNLLMLHKNYPKGFLWLRLLFVRFFLDLVAALRFLCSDGWQHAWAIIRAWRDFLKLYRSKDLDPKHLLTPIERRRGYRQLFPKSIVFEYFCRGKRHYSDL